MKGMQHLLAHDGFPVVQEADEAMQTPPGQDLIHPAGARLLPAPRQSSNQAFRD